MWFGKKKKNESEVNDLFTEKWIEKWEKSINNSEEYYKAGLNWNAPIILKFETGFHQFDDPDAIGFYLDLKNGICETLRYAFPNDITETDIVISAAEKEWVQLILHKKDPMMQILKKKLKIEKGSYTLLSIHHKSAKALLKTAPSDVQINKSILKNSENEPNGYIYNQREKYISTTKGLNHESFPLQLFQKSKQLGIWNPSNISFEKDCEQWDQFTEEEKGILIHLSSLFMAGEEAVTLDLLPLINVVASEQRIEEEIYLTSFLWEEAKHTEFFSLFVNKVMDIKPDFNKYHKPFYKIIFYDKLPSALHRLEVDKSVQSQLRASIIYNMIVEGTLAETGYEAYFKMLEDNDLMPGLREGLKHLKRDESRHIAFGLYFINRLLDENPNLKSLMESELEILLNDATNIIHEIFDQYDVVPFGLEKEWFLNYAIRQFQARFEKLGL
ncbi:MAG: R2-like ligand-binding oxidase [Balneolaceae bacterium]